MPAWRPCSTWRSPTGVTTWWTPATCPARWSPATTPGRATLGTARRPGVDAAGVDGLALAGDWVGPDGMLADASILSGVAAARHVVATARRVTGAPV